MHIEQGKIVKFAQSFSSPVNGHWGALEKVIRFPEGIPPILVEAIDGKQVNDIAKVPMTYLEGLSYDDALVMKVNKQMLQKTEKIELGMVFQASFKNRQLQGVVKDIFDNTVLLDCNHPMAGEKNAVTSLHILEVRNPTKEESTNEFTPTSRAI